MSGCLWEVMMVEPGQEHGRHHQKLGCPGLAPATCPVMSLPCLAPAIALSCLVMSEVMLYPFKQCNLPWKADSSVILSSCFWLGLCRLTADWRFRSSGRWQILHCCCCCCCCCCLVQACCQCTPMEPRRLTDGSLANASNAWGTAAWRQRGSLSGSGATAAAAAAAGRLG